jgi:hypothetical protein
LNPGESAELQGLSRASIATTLDLSAQTEDDDVSANDYMKLPIGPSPFGSADLQLTSIETRPGANAGEYVLRVTITNTGPATHEDPSTFAAVQADDHPVFSTVTVRGTAVTPGWTCGTPIYCYTSAPFAAGASAVIDFAVSGRDDWLRFDVESGQRVPDPLPENNTRPIVW